MLTTKQLLGMSASDAIAAMLNDINPGLNLNGRDVVFGSPQALGATLTQIQMSMRPQYSSLDYVPYTGSVNFTYNRLDISNFAALAFVDYNPDLPVTTQDLLDRMSGLFGCTFDPNDFVLEQITSANNGTYTLKTRPTSLRWVGSYDVVFGASTVLFISGTPPDVIVNKPYSFQFSIVGGKAPYTWSAQGLPSGIAIDQTGTLSGQTATLGPNSVTVVAVDSQGTQQQIGITLNVVKPTLINPVLAIDEAYPSATVSVPYSQDIAITGGDGTYSNPVLTQGTMPPGLSLSIVGSNLRLSGTPTATYFGLIGVGCSSGDGQTVNQLMQFVTLQPMQIVGSYTQAESGKPFVDALAITGGSGDYFLPMLTNGSELPPGIDTLIINDERIEIRGTPTTPGTYPFDVIILTGYGQYLTTTLSLTVIAGTPVSYGTAGDLGYPL